MNDLIVVQVYDWLHELQHEALDFTETKESHTRLIDKDVNQTRDIDATVFKG